MQGKQSVPGSSEKSFDVQRYWEDRLTRDYSLASVGWLGLGTSYNRWMYRVRQWLFMHRVPRFCPRADFDVLDIGSGTGFYIALWERLSPRSITGIDITDIAIRRLTELFPNHTFIRADITDEVTGIVDKQFDVISAMDMLFHLVDDDDYRHALHNVSALLKPGGIFIFTENFLHVKESKGVHQVSRSLKTLRTLIQEVGLDEISRRPVFVLMNSPTDSSSRVHAKFWSLLSRGVQHHELIGAFTGACLYPLEIILASALSEGPSTEMMVCQKPSYPVNAFEGFSSKSCANLGRASEPSP